MRFWAASNTMPSGESMAPLVAWLPSATAGLAVPFPAKVVMSPLAAAAPVVDRTTGRSNETAVRPAATDRATRIHGDDGAAARLARETLTGTGRGRTPTVPSASGGCFPGSDPLSSPSVDSRFLARSTVPGGHRQRAVLRPDDFLSEIGRGAWLLNGSAGPASCGERRSMPEIDGSSTGYPTAATPTVGQEAR